MIHSVPECLKCRSEPDKPQALTQCTHTHTHSHTLSLTSQEGSVWDIQEFLISATRANAGALCLKRNDKWGAMGWLTEPAVLKKKEKMNLRIVLSAECDPCLTAEWRQKWGFSDCSTTEWNPNMHRYWIWSDCLFYGLDFHSSWNYAKWKVVELRSRTPFMLAVTA